MPFPIVTPVKHLERVKLHFKGFNFDKSDSLEQTAMILGFVVVEEEKLADLVVLSKQKYEKLTKSSKSKFKGVYKQEKWFLKVLTQGVLGSDVEELVGIKVTPNKN